VKAKAPVSSPRTLGEVPEGDRVRVASGEYRVGARLAGVVLVMRESDGPRQGPYVMHPSEPVLAHRPKAFAAVDTTQVADPLAGLPSHESNLFSRED